MSVDLEGQKLAHNYGDAGPARRPGLPYPARPVVKRLLDLDRGAISCELVLDLPGVVLVYFFFQAEDGIRDYKVTGVQTCALPICPIDPGEGLPQVLQAVQGDR